MRHIVFAVSFAILTLAGCSGIEITYPERLELQPGYFDPR
jgi:hypothetical protein